MCRPLDIRRVGDVKDVNMSIYRFPAGQIASIVGVSRQEEELRVRDKVHVGLRSYGSLARGVLEGRQRHDILPLVHDGLLVLGRVLQQAGVSTGCRARPAVLDSGGLKKHP